MLVNGDFTDGLNGWNFRLGSTSLTLDTTDGGESPPSGVVTRISAPDTYWSGLWQKLWVKGGETYFYSVRLKAPVGVQHYANIDFYDKNGYVSGWWELLIGTGQWQTVQAEIMLPEGITNIDVGAFTGTRWDVPPPVGTTFSIDDAYFGKKTAPFFPYLPDEIPPTEAEQSFIDLQPYGLWPENQDSNFGQLRRVITDQVQVNIDKVNSLALEMWPDESTDYISLWEEMLGLPVAPSGKALIQRRAIATSARKKGAFTRQRIRNVIEEFIGATFGEAATFGPGGLDLSSGVSLLSGATSFDDAYRVYEDFRNFAYEVYVKTGISPDARLIEELKRVTPAGITPTLTTVANVLNMNKTVRNLQPEMYLRLASLADSSGNGGIGLTNLNGTNVGGGSGLMSSSINDGPGASAYFDGVNDDVRVTGVKNLGDRWSYFGIIVPATVSGVRPLISRNGAFVIYANGDALQFQSSPGWSAFSLSGVFSTSVGCTIGVVKDGPLVQLFKNGVKIAETTTYPEVMADATTEIRLGNDFGTNYFNGFQQEVQLYDEKLTEADFLRLHKVANNIAT